MSLLRQVGKTAFAIADVALPTPRGPRILIYHQVRSAAHKQTEVSLADFEWQLDWLMRNRDVVDLGSALKSWSETDSANLVVITFDDGYEDVFLKAYPLLLERQLPFTLYLTSGFLDGETVGGGAADASPLSWSMVREMLRSGLLTIGAHTHSHPDMRGLRKPEVIRELVQSDDTISSRLGVAPQHFAYPWGYWSVTADDIVRERYSSAVLGAKQPGSSSDFDPWLLFRVPIQSSDTTRWFGSRLEGGLAAEEWIRRRIRRYKGP